MISFKKIGYTFFFIICFAACDSDFLNRTPLDSVTDADFFEQAEDFTVYVNRFYTTWGNRGRWFGDFGTDIEASHESPPNRMAGVVTINNGPSYSYSDIRRVNYLLEAADRWEGDFEDIKNAVGEAHYFRARFHFNLLKDFGDIHWLDFVPGTTSEELYHDRDSRDVVVDNIIEDLNLASIYLPHERGNGYSRLNRWEALLLQARVALYEGTWQKYHEGTPFGVANSDPAKYFNVAISAADEIMESGLYGIYSTGDPESDYYNNFNRRDYSDHPEAIRWTNYSLEHDVTNWLLEIWKDPTERGMTKELVEHYLDIEGRPIAVSNLYLGDNTIEEEVQFRDPRLNQTIFTQDDIWLIRPDGEVEYYSANFEVLFSNTRKFTPTGYHRRKFYRAEEIYHFGATEEETPVLNDRYAEVLLIFAEAKAELGTITQAELDKSINLLRDRVGMPHMQLHNITPDPNWTWPELSPLINEIRRERVIELAAENFRLDDLLRWASMDKFNGTRPKGTKIDQFPITPDIPVDENGYLDPFRNTYPGGFNFDTGRHYLWPIPESQIVLNPTITQNPGW